jgi:hypothetical protein
VPAMGRRREVGGRGLEPWRELTRGEAGDCPVAVRDAGVMQEVGARRRRAGGLLRRRRCGLVRGRCPAGGR